MAIANRKPRTSTKESTIQTSNMSELVLAAYASELRLHPADLQCLATDETVRMNAYAVAAAFDYILHRLKIKNPSKLSLQLLKTAKLRAYFLRNELEKRNPAKDAEYFYAIMVEYGRRLCDEIAPAASDVFQMAFPLFESSAAIDKRMEDAA
jgi:hypothetical protein